MHCGARHWLFLELSVRPIRGIVFWFLECFISFVSNVHCPLYSPRPQKINVNPRCYEENPGGAPEPGMRPSEQ